MDKQSNYMGMPYGDPSANISANPYLNFDPAFLSPGGDSQFIFPEGASQRRGRLELAFSQIGGSVFVGAAFGGLNGFYSGLKETRAAELTGAVRRTQMLNFIAKQGASSAQTLGVVALMYSVFGVILSKSRGADDELNTVAAGTMTGLLFKSSAGMRNCLRGGAIGFGLSSAYVLATRLDRIKQMIGMDS
eukprot:GHVU01156477.1.p1 GENE.GHVU01156477.1~~GHVU01156477.1.p1  ORF type:complete len:213 (+),score=6.59 GHVU01156477.1:72-641(+)